MSSGWFVVLSVLATIAVGLVIFTSSKKWKGGTADRLEAATGVTSVVLAVVALAVSVPELTPEEGGDVQSDNSTTTGDAEGSICVYVEGDCPSGLPPADELAEFPVAEAVEKLQELPGSQDPPPRLPANYIVLGTNEQGVFVRDGTDEGARRLPGEPTVTDGRPVYADCRVSNGWVADNAAPNAQQHDAWIKIRYPEPGDVGETYVYGGFVFPVGHNGELPECP